MYGPFSLVISSCFFRHVGWIRGKLTERVVNPVHKEPLDVIAVALDCLFAAS